MVAWAQETAWIVTLACVFTCVGVDWTIPAFEQVSTPCIQVIVVVSDGFKPDFSFPG